MTVATYEKPSNSESDMSVGEGIDGPSPMNGSAGAVFFSERCFEDAVQNY